MDVIKSDMTSTTLLYQINGIIIDTMIRINDIYQYTNHISL